MIEWILVHIPLLSIMQVVIFAGFPATVQTTTGNITATSPTDNDVSGEIKTLWLSVAPILLVVGVVGNCLILVTMTRQQMSGTSTCVYLVAMAVLDTVVLVVGLIPDWLEGSSIVVLKVSYVIKLSINFIAATIYSMHCLQECSGTIIGISPFRPEKCILYFKLPEFMRPNLIYSRPDGTRLGSLKKAQHWPNKTRQLSTAALAHAYFQARPRADGLRLK